MTTVYTLIKTGYSQKEGVDLRALYAKIVGKDTAVEAYPVTVENGMDYTFHILVKFTAPDLAKIVKDISNLRTLEGVVDLDSFQVAQKML